MGKSLKIGEPLIFSALACLFLACAAPEKPAGLVEPAYFNIDKALDQQIALLNNKNAGTEKKSQSGKTVENKTLPTINWQRELDIFRQAAINRPAWRNDFEVDSATAPNGNLTVTYQRKPESDAPVKTLEVQLNRAAQLLYFKANIAADNMLFNSGKFLEMQFSNSASPVLENYKIEGAEQMVFSDAKSYSLRGDVIL